MNISRRQFLKTVTVSTAAISLAGCSTLSGSTSPKAKKPNIIYILADDLGYGDLSAYGQKKFNTPNIDRLGSEGMTFTDHYSGSTVCAPSRCSLMTGLHTGHCQVRGNKEIKPEGQWPMKAGTVTVASMLKEAGYTTGAFGKWGLGAPGTEGDPNNQGFDYFYGYNCQREAHKYYRKHLWRNQEKVQLPNNNPEAQTGEYCQDLISREALDFVRRNRSQPFFMYVPFVIPHAELAVPADSMAKYKGKFKEPKPFTPDNEQGYGTQKTPRAAFAAMVDRMDGDVGRLMALLKELAIDDNTIVMFASDNGPHQEGGADPEFFNSNGPLRGHKRDLYEGGIRTPMLVRWPDKIAKGSKTDHISAFWDVMPTCADLAGLEMSTETDGISFVPTLLGQGKRQKQHRYLYWEFHERGGKQAVRMGQWKGVRLNVKKNPAAPIELYNLSQDIGETTNVAEKYPAIVQTIEAIMSEARTPNDVFRFMS